MQLFFMHGVVGMKAIKRWKEHFQGFFEIIFSETNTYQYSLKNVELKVRNGVYDNVIKYILIGSRRIQQDSASNLIIRRVFKKFNEVDAEVIVTINTATTLLNCASKEEMVSKVNLYVKNIREKNEA